MLTDRTNKHKFKETYSKCCVTFLAEWLWLKYRKNIASESNSAWSFTTIVQTKCLTFICMLIHSNNHCLFDSKYFFGIIWTFLCLSHGLGDYCFVQIGKVNFQQLTCYKLHALFAYAIYCETYHLLQGICLTFLLSIQRATFKLIFFNILYYRMEQIRHRLS